MQLENNHVRKWSYPLYRAYIAGAWILQWTDDTLYWIAKPIVSTETTSRSRRLHNNSGPALQSDLEDLYFWHGVLVPEQVIMQPDTLTPGQILKETNAEVRRVMIERFGLDRFLSSGHAKQLDQSDRGILYRLDLANDEPVVSVKVKCSTTGQIYFLRVPPTIQKADDAVAWTFSMKKEDYAPQKET